MNLLALYIINLIVLNFLPHKVQSKNDYHPKNIAVKQKETITLSCINPESENISGNTWQYSDVDLSVPDIIFNGNNISTRYNHITRNCSHKGFCDLVLNKTELQHSGTYECLSGEKTYSSELIVLEKDPVCKINNSNLSNNSVSIANGDVIQIECSINFRGRLAPVMRWYQDGQLNTDGVKTQTTANERVTTVLTVMVKYTKNSQKAVKYSCKTDFSETFENIKINKINNNANIASNIPEYNFTWEIFIKELDKSSFLEIVTKENTNIANVDEIKQMITVAVVVVVLIFILTTIAIVAFMICHQKTVKVRVDPAISSDVTLTQKVSNVALSEDKPQLNVEYAEASATARSKCELNTVANNPIINVSSSKNHLDLDESYQGGMDAMGYSEVCQTGRKCKLLIQAEMNMMAISNSNIAKLTAKDAPTDRNEVPTNNRPIMPVPTNEIPANKPEKIRLPKSQVTNHRPVMQLPTTSANDIHTDASCSVLQMENEALPFYAQVNKKKKAADAVDTATTLDDIATKDDTATSEDSDTSEETDISMTFKEYNEIHLKDKNTDSFSAYSTLSRLEDRSLRRYIKVRRSQGSDNNLFVPESDKNDVPDPYYVTLDDISKKKKVPTATLR